MPTVAPNLKHAATEKNGKTHAAVGLLVLIAGIENILLTWHLLDNPQVKCEICICCKLQLESHPL